MDVGAWVNLTNVKADFLISFNWIVNLPYCFQKQFRSTMLEKALQNSSLMEPTKMATFQNVSCFMRFNFFMTLFLVDTVDNIFKARDY